MRMHSTHTKSGSFRPVPSPIWAVFPCIALYTMRLVAFYVHIKLSNHPQFSIASWFYLRWNHHVIPNLNTLAVWLNWLVGRAKVHYNQREKDTTTISKPKKSSNTERDDGARNNKEPESPSPHSPASDHTKRSSVMPSDSSTNAQQS